MIVVGVGLDGVSALIPEARQALEAVDVIYGGKRHLDGLGQEFCAERRLWGVPFSKTVEDIANLRAEKRIGILASGDPFWYGVGATLSQYIPADEMQVYPHVSAFSMAAAQMGWALQHTACLSCHGRPITALHRWLAKGRRWLVLTDNGLGPCALAAWLTDNGWGRSLITVFEALSFGEVSTRNSGRYDCTAKSCPQQRFNDLNTVAVELRPDFETRCLNSSPGLPDDAFVHDGKITRQVVRTASLTALAPFPGALLWDVGAGSGSIGIEWLRMEPSATAIAIEPRADRREMIKKNQVSLGVPDLMCVAGSAPDALEEVMQLGKRNPDAIFIGGGLSSPGLVDACLEALCSGGRLVANAVTLEGEVVLLSLQERLGGELVRISIAHARPVGPFRGWQPAMPVTQFRYTQP